MFLPENVQISMEKLEKSGFSCYAVGGCVRDALLGLTPHDYDLCTSATPAQTSQVFADYPQIHAGEKHGTVGIIFPNKEVYEITTFRTEGAYSDSRHPDWVAFVPDVEQDCARRDFTINAMAYSPSRGLIDPFGGQDDLKSKTLRAVGDPQRRFSEDALRILRGVRFATKFGLTVEPETKKAMVSLAPLMDKLARERVFDELCKLLPKVNAQNLVEFAPIITQVIPELAPCIGFDQKNAHHIYDVYTHIAHVVESTPPDLALRWAALLHDVGKPACFTQDSAGVGHFYGHAAESSRLASQILLRLKASNALRSEVCQLVKLHMNEIPAQKKGVTRFLSRHGAKTLENLLLLQKADGFESPEADTIRTLAAQIMQERGCLSLQDLAVNGHDLMALGYSGSAIGQALKQLLEAVLEEQVENEKNELLSYLLGANHE